MIVHDRTRLIDRLIFSYPLPTAAAVSRAIALGYCGFLYLFLLSDPDTNRKLTCNLMQILNNPGLLLCFAPLFLFCKILTIAHFPDSCAN